jgi:hypothetical protein
MNAEMFHIAVALAFANAPPTIPYFGTNNSPSKILINVDINTMI